MDIARIRRGGVALAFAALTLLVCATPRADAAVKLHGAVPYSYDYDLTWSPATRTLRGKALLRVTNSSAKPIQSVWLRLRPNYPTELEQISNMRGASINGRTADGSMVLVRLRGPLNPNYRARIYFDLRLKVPKDDTSLGRSAGVDLFGDALPVVAVAGPRGLRKGPEPSYGEGSFNAVASWKVRLSVPRNVSAILPGDTGISGGTKSTKVSYFSTAKVRDYAFAIGKVYTRSKRVNGVLIEVAASQQLRSQLPAALRRAANAFTKMQGWYGGYSLSSLRVVLGDLDFGGSEYPGLVFSTPDNATIAHEVAHQWFYGLVGNDQYNDPFLDESLTAFAEQRFHKSYRCNLASPIDGRSHGLGTGMSYWENHPAAYEHTIYRGGACALTVLQRDLGPAVFDQALRAYVAANANQLAGVDDFLAAIRSAAPNYDLARWEKLVGL
jgi:hypothetical protein